MVAAVRYCILYSPPPIGAIGCLDCETREEALARRVSTAFRWAHASRDNAEPGVPRSS